MNFYLTTAGLAALVNPANTGTNAILIDRIGVSSVVLAGDPTSHAGLVALPNELKRLSTFAGANVGDNTIHVTIRDESADSYALRTFGLYASTGVLMAYVTSAEPISQKTPSSMTLIAADLAFVVAVVAEVTFGATDFLNPPATTVTPGVVELATKEETLTGTDTVRAVTPYGLKWVLDQLLAGFAALNHTHDASATVSGVFNVGRIPSLDMSKILGLATALANKLEISNFTWANLSGKPNVAIQNTDVHFGDLHAARAGPSGVLYLGDQSSGGRWLFYNGATYELPGAHLSVNGGSVWTTSNFDPATKAPALHSHDWAQVTGKPANLLAATGALTGSADWNAITAAGVYDVTPAGAWHANNPVAAYAYGQLIVTSGDLNTVHQVYWTHYAECWSRQSFNGAWTPWRKSWNSENFDPTTKVTNGQASIQAGSGGNGYTLLSGGNVNYTGTIAFHLGDGTRLGYIGAASDANKAIVFAAENGGSFYFGARPNFGGATPWDSANFTPANKIDQSTGPTIIKGGLYGLSTATGAGSGAGVGSWSRFSSFTGGSADANAVVYGALGDNANPGYAYIGVGEAVTRYASLSALRVYPSYAAWGDKPLWHSGNFDPSTKAAASHTHTTADITDLLDKFWPAGELRLYAKNALPSGGVRVLAANGAAVSRTTYARLFAEIGTAFGAGDGATTFNLPDFRGVFFRGLDQGRGLDTGRGVGVLQMSQNLAHDHSYLLQTGTDNTQAGSGVQGGAAYGGETTGSSGGSEARPINQALLACVTY